MLIGDIYVNDDDDDTSTVNLAFPISFSFN